MCLYDFDWGKYCHCMNADLCSKLDPCDQRLTLGIENLMFNVSLYDFDWDKYCHCMNAVLCSKT